jgi:hypothetical protein
MVAVIEQAEAEAVAGVYSFMGKPSGSADSSTGLGR